MSDVSFRDFVLDQLRGLGDVRAQSMFGGYGLYLGGKFFGIVHRSALYLRTTDETRVVYERQGMMPFRPNERQTLKRYYEVPADAVDDPDTLVEWARPALEA